MSLYELVAAKLGLTGEQFAASLATYGYVGFWIATSAGVILYNKWILTTWGFHFPITLTMWHMFFCSLVSFALVRKSAPHARARARSGRPAPPRSALVRDPRVLTPRRCAPAAWSAWT
jgi:hypothetical protein